ncbi:MAG: bifunctional hydroxymethylpyrimidine kinase/phosphomethylpyrimidine kinase [Candidatus Aminicenantes bacterium]|nr:bifunctional hydroxymethylpyrimidine kinase/phosphomethylpyrimidine kinase [Candidatus Aminicenantes bacterium]
MAAEVESLVADWDAFRGEGIQKAAGAGNRVSLLYPREGERVEILRSAVSALNPENVLIGLTGLSFLIMVVNSGYELDLGAWRRILDAAGCPVWLDIHSLTLERVLGRPRTYRAVPEWEDWALGTAYLQANRKEVACMLGTPEQEAGNEEIRAFCRRALDLGLKAVFVTLGREGALVATPEAEIMARPARDVEVMDTTGCGDVFCAAAASVLSRGASPGEAARFGTDLASRAAQVAGVRAAYELAQKIARLS